MTIWERDGTTASTVHLWNSQNIVAEVGTTGTVTARYLRGINLIAREQDSANQYYLFNAHGDVIQRTDAWGNVLKNYRYDAFGNEQNPEKLDSNPFRYCGEYVDRETGELYLRARYYNPVIGRFGAEDSVKSTSYKLPNEQEITNSLSLNLYTYGSNNPVLYVDNSGNFAVLAVAAIALGIGIIADIASGSVYARYSTMAQDANWYTVDAVYMEKMTGTKRERLELNKMLEWMTQGDTVVIESLSLLDRSTKDMIELTEMFQFKGVHLVSLKKSITTNVFRQN